MIGILEGSIFPPSLLPPLLSPGGDPNGPDNDGVPMPLWRPFRDEEPNAMWLRDRGCECVIDKPDKVSEIIAGTMLAKQA